MGSLVFWGAVALMLVSVALVLGRALQTTAATEPVSDVQVYKNHLAEIDRDVARGVVSDIEAARMRVEVSRRILAADRQHAVAPTSGHAGILMGAIALVLGAAVWGLRWPKNCGQTVRGKRWPRRK
jgi:cytochrome c-type biogenesis protein CcmH